MTDREAAIRSLREHSEEVAYWMAELAAAREDVEVLRQERDEFRSFWKDAREREKKLEDALRRAVDDYDLHRSTWWGRFLLWLLRKTT